jgi:hypothetical protein
MRSRNRTAQAMLEYVVVAMIVMMAVIFGGPSLVNSIGAYFRIAENNAGDAYNEEFKIAAPGTICSCDLPLDDPKTWHKGGCTGDACDPTKAAYVPTLGCGIKGCSSTERAWTRTCPDNCKREVACFSDAECCGPINLRQGTVSDPALCVKRAEMDERSQLLFPGATGKCQDAEGGETGCKVGETLCTVNCGDSVLFSCNCTCTDTEWTPSTNTVCEGVSLSQKSNCANERTTVGTLECNGRGGRQDCTVWSPDLKDFCTTAQVEQTNCGRRRTSFGEKDCTTLDPCENACFIAGTKILMGDGTFKAIERVKKGDIVQGSDKSNKVEETLVLEHDGWLYSINGAGYFVTPVHPFMTEGGIWKAFDPDGAMKVTPELVVKQLGVGDILITRNGTVTLIKVDRIQKKGVVYNFVVSGSHDYYADGYLVHNKKPCVQGDTCGPYEECTPCGYCENVSFK